MLVLFYFFSIKDEAQKLNLVTKDYFLIIKNRYMTDLTKLILTVICIESTLKAKHWDLRDKILFGIVYPRRQLRQ